MKLPSHEFVALREEYDWMSKSEFVKFISNKYELTTNAVYKRYREMQDIIPDVFTSGDVDGEELNKSIVRRLHMGTKPKDIAEFFDVSRSKVYRLARKYKIDIVQKRFYPAPKNTRLRYLGEAYIDKYGKRRIFVQCSCPDKTVLDVDYYRWRDEETTSCGCKLRAVKGRWWLLNKELPPVTLD